jgi:hypothetical protein
LPAHNEKSFIKSGVQLSKNWIEKKHMESCLHVQYSVINPSRRLGFKNYQRVYEPIKLNQWSILWDVTKPYSII